MSSEEDEELAQLRAQRQARTGMPSLVYIIINTPISLAQSGFLNLDNTYKAV